MYGLIGRILAIPGERDALLAILLESSRDLPGCLSYVIATDLADPNAIVITEVWDSAESHRASLSLPAVREAIGQARPLIAGFGESLTTEPVGGVGLAVPPPGLANRSMPPGAIIPELAYTDVAVAAAWLCAAFGFRERLRIGAHRRQLVYGDEAIVVTDGANEAPGGQRLMVRVANADAHCARAVQAGARILTEPTTHPFGERQYTAEDIGGHRWTFSQSVADVDPEAWGGVVVEG